MSIFGESRTSDVYLQIFRENFFDNWRKSEFAERSITILANICNLAGQCAIDGGANHGRHLWPLATAVGPTGKVIA